MTLETGWSVAGTPLRQTVFPLALMLAGLLSSDRFALAQTEKVRIAETQWGFDGRVMRGQFQPLSILLDNLSEQPIEDAHVELTAIGGMMRELGGVYRTPVYLGPNSRRWVQFYPYIFGRIGSWQVRLITKDGEIKFDHMDQPRLVLDEGEDDGQGITRAAVILDPTGMLPRAPTSVKHMPAEIFPPYSTATHGLYAVFLDHVPDWEEPRQQALLAWLQRGGHLHLLQDSNREDLRFSGPLAVLNEPFPEFSVSAGTVVRHGFQREDLSDETVKSIVFMPAKPQQDEESTKAFQTQSTSGFSWDDMILDDDDLFGDLRKRTEPKHAWPLLFMLTLVYVALLFPGAWILSKERRVHYLVPHAAILGGVTLFSVLFAWLGQRGYNETSSLTTLVYAEGEDNTHWSGMQFSHLFATTGGNYQLSEKAKQTLPGSAASDERVDAICIPGENASYAAAMPPFSTQPVVMRRRLETADWGLQVMDYSANAGGLVSLTLGYNQQAPVTERTLAYVLSGNEIFSLKSDNVSRRFALSGGHQKIKDFSRLGLSDNFDPWTGVIADKRSLPTDPDEQFRDRCVRRMVRRSLVESCARSADEVEIPPGKIRVLIFFDLTKDHFLTSDPPIAESGFVLYSRELALTSQ